MKLKLPLLALCVIFFLLSLVVGRSAGGVANSCKKGKFFDRSRQQYLPCHECKSEIQECFTCCQSEAETQDDGRNAKNLNSSTSHHRAKDAAGAKKEAPLPAKIESSLPKVLVASTASVFFVASLIVLLLVVIRSSSGPSEETNEDASRSQRSEVVTEVTMMELKDEINNSSTLSDGNVHT